MITLISKNDYGDYARYLIRSTWYGVLAVLLCACLAHPQGLADQAQPSREAAVSDALREAARQAEIAKTLRAVKIRAALPLTGPLQVAGEIRLFVDGEEQPLSEPIRLVDEKALVPLREAAAKLYYGLVSLGGGTFELIAPDGKRKTAEVALIEGVPVIIEEEIEDYFSVQARFDQARQEFHIQTPAPSPLVTYSIEKPEEEIEREIAPEKPILPTAAEVPPKERYVPGPARPSVQMHGQVSYSYSDPHAAPPTRQLTTSLAGQMLDFDVRFESVRRDLGDIFQHDYTYLNFSKPGLFLALFDQSSDLFPLRAQSQAFEGVKLKKSLGERHVVTLAGGDIENTASGTAGSVKYLGRMYEAREEYTPAKWFRYKGGFFYVENEADLPSQAGGSGFPRNSLVSFSGLDLDLPGKMVFSGDLARSDYEPDNEPDGSVEDWNWRTGLTLDTEMFRTGFAYEFVGDRYASLGNPGSYNDYQGWSTFANYRVTEGWSVSSSLLRYRNNVDDDASDTTAENQSISLSSSHRLTQRQSLNLSFSQLFANPSGPNAGSSSRANLYRADYFFPFFFDSRLLTNYQYFHNRAPAASDTVSHTAGTSLFKSYGKGSSLYLNQLFGRNFLEGQDDNLNWTASFNLDHRLFQEMSLFLNSSYARDKTDAVRATETVSGSTGLRWQPLRETSLRAEYNIGSYNLKTEKGRWPRNWSLLFSISQGLPFSTPPNFGAIEGWVFEDLNANGLLERGERPMQGVVINLEERAQAISDSAGRFKFTRVVPGRRHVMLDLSSLDPIWTARASRQSVEVRRRKKLKTYFGIAKAATIRTRVFIDDNRDLIFQDTEEPLEDVSVILQPGEQFRRSDANGAVLFENLLPGRYSLQLYPENIPAGYELISPETIEIEAKPGEELEAPHFAIGWISVPVTRFEPE